ncbi:Cas9 endonuclease PAM-interacting domain-containing protein [Dolosicoccus paucivorans]
MINKIVGLFRVESRKDIKELKINKDYVLNRNLSNQSEVILIRQSITGLFEERIDVLNL